MKTVVLYLHGSPPDGLRSKSWRQNAKKSLTRCGLATFVLMGCGERGVLAYFGKKRQTIESLQMSFFQKGF